MFPNVRSVEPDESVASVPAPDLYGELLHLTRRVSGTKLERRMTELERAKISERIKEARIQAGITQEELADLLHVRARTIANYEAGRVPWRLLGQIAEATGKTQEWLLHGELLTAEQGAEGALARIEANMASALKNQKTVLAQIAKLAKSLDDLTSLVEDVSAGNQRAPKRKTRAS